MVQSKELQQVFPKVAKLWTFLARLSHLPRVSGHSTTVVEEKALHGADDTFSGRVHASSAPGRIVGQTGIGNRVCGTVGVGSFAFQISTARTRNHDQFDNDQRQVVFKVSNLRGRKKFLIVV